MMRQVLTIALAMGILIATTHAADEDLAVPVDIGSRRELFVDRLLIHRLDGAELRLHRPVEHGHALEFDQSWEGPFSAYVTILHDGARYQAYCRGLSRASKVRVPRIAWPYIS